MTTCTRCGTPLVHEQVPLAELGKPEHEWDTIDGSLTCPNDACRLQRALQEHYIWDMVGVIDGTSPTCLTCGANVDHRFAEYHIAWHRRLGHEVVTRDHNQHAT